MTTAFVTPGWVTRLNAAVEDALPEGYALAAPVADRHGSWEWAARRTTMGDPAEPWLIATATPLGGRADWQDELPATVSVAAWQLVPDGTAVVESTLVSAEITDLVDMEDPEAALALALQSVVHEAARLQAGATPRTVPHQRSGHAVLLARAALVFVGAAVLLVAVLASSRTSSVVLAVVQAVALVAIAARFDPSRLVELSRSLSRRARRNRQPF